MSITYTLYAYASTTEPRYADTLNPTTSESAGIFDCDTTSATVEPKTAPTLTICSPLLNVYCSSHWIVQVLILVAPAGLDAVVSVCITM